MRFSLHDLNTGPTRLPFSRKSMALLGCILLHAASVMAQVPVLPATSSSVSTELELVLKSSPELMQQFPAAARAVLPTFVQGAQISGRPDQQTVIEGNAVLRRGNLVIKADRMEYDRATDWAKAEGNVRVNRAGNVYEGPLLELKLESFEGFFKQPRYYFLNNDAHGEADRIDFIDEQKAVITGASFTTCRRLPGPSWVPDWILRATTLNIDNLDDTGRAEGALLSFKGVPLLPLPNLSFPLSDRRKSGFLPPTLGLDNVNGAEVSVPYYWNIAPNRDATFTPTLMSKRGINLGGEFRYLEPSYSGQAHLDLMPVDQLRGSQRWGMSFLHQAQLNDSLTHQLTDAGAALNVNLNRVSDDNYWRDFAKATTSLTQRLLSNDATLSWNNGNFSSNLRTLKWQTLQDVTAPITPPYDRLPQLATRYGRSNINGFDYSVDVDYTRFEADGSLTLQPNAQRIFSWLQISRPWVAPAGFITPKLQLHASNYQFDAPLGDGARSASRVLPTFSLDSGLVFERDASYFGRSFRQTLEPRAFYVNTPYRDQSYLPNYDSGVADFNFASIYTENAFVGNDRISDSNLLTLGLSSRLLDPATGAETVRLGVAQRLRFRDQNVTLPGGAPSADRLSDLLLGAAINWDPTWAFDSTVQFNPKTEQSVRSTIGARYNPGNYRTVTAAYRYQRDASEQLDMGWQWPVNDLWGDKGQDLGPGQGQGFGRWYSVGRLNYSLDERKLVDAIIGFEYDAGCWLGRAVWEQLQTSTSSATQRIMFQLEFVGFTRLGVNPLKTLKDNIPNYQYLREKMTAPSRFSNYE
jgi:LPS-assembly protein